MQYFAAQKYQVPFNLQGLQFILYFTQFCPEKGLESDIIFKDNDFLKDGVKIHIGEEAKAKLMETLISYACELRSLH